MVQLDLLYFPRVMGNFYTNVVVRGGDVDAATSVLNELNRTAFVCAAENTTVVYDAKCDEQDLMELERLAAALSRRLKSAALAVCNHDDDVLWYALAENGSIVDRYDSNPGYFKGNATDSRGGDAEKLCNAFEVPHQIPAVTALLRQPRADVGLEVDRHESLRVRLGLPEHLCMLGYRYVSSGELNDHPASSTMRATGAARLPTGEGGGTQTREEIEPDTLSGMAEQARAMFEGQPDVFWDATALALAEVKVPERFLPLFGIARGSGLELYEILSQYAVQRGVKLGGGMLRCDDLLTEFLGQRDIVVHALVRLTRIALGIPPLSAEHQAAYLSGDAEFLERVARAHVALEQRGEETDVQASDES